MRRNKLHSDGFTLVELLLYISISTTVLIAGSLFMASMFSARVKSQAVNEVEQQGVAAMHVITEAIRNAENITAPAIGVTSGSLTIDVITTSNDPTLFDQSLGTLRIKEGSGANIPLTNSRVTMSDLSFQNVSRSGTPGSVQVRFTLMHANPSNRQEYQVNKTFYGSATLRQP